MMPADIIIRDFDANGWANFLSLADPNTLRRLVGEAEREQRKRTRLVIIFEDNNVLKAYHNEKGSILDGFKWDGTMHIEAIARREEVDEVVALDRNALGRIFSRFQNKINMRDDYPKQLLEIYDAIRLEIGNGLYLYPTRKLRTIDYEKIRKAFNFAAPDNSTFIFYLFDGNEIWGSLIAGIKGGEVILATTHDALEAHGVYIYNWRKDYKKVLSASKRIFMKPSIGIFCDVRAFARVLRSRKKTLKALNDEVKRKNIILDPFPILLKTALKAGKFFI